MISLAHYHLACISYSSLARIPRYNTDDHHVIQIISVALHRGILLDDRHIKEIHRHWLFGTSHATVVGSIAGAQRGKSQSYAQKGEYHEIT